jgi:hypothetical protein
MDPSTEPTIEPDEQPDDLGQFDAAAWDHATFA